MANLPGRPFTDILAEIERGEVLHELTQAVYDVTEAVMETRKAGSITLQLTISPTGKGTVNVTAKVNTKKPVHNREITTFFVGPDFGLTRHDPNQPRLPLTKVDLPDNEPIRVRE